MMPGPLDLDVYEGDDLEIPLTLSSGGVPVDLSVYAEAKAQVKTEAGGTVVLTFTATIHPSIPGRVTLVAPGTDTTGSPGDYAWDLELSSPRRTFLAGAFHIEPEITT